MKLFFSALMSISCSLIGFSQEVDSRLLDRYTSEELITLNDNNPQAYSLLVYALDNAIYLTDISKEKHVDLRSIDISGKAFNFIALGLDIKNVNQYFKVLGRDKILVVKSRYVLSQESK